MLNRLSILSIGLIGLLLTSCKKDITIQPYHTDGEVIKLLQGPANGVNVVILGDGYTKAGLIKGGLFDIDTKSVTDYIFTIQPYSTYKQYFNVYAVCAQSNQEGAGHGTPNPNTKFNSYFASSSDRLIVSDNYTVYNAYAQKAVPNGNVDLLILLVNDATYGGSGGAIAVVTTHNGFEQTVIHEMGHTFANLGDEYVDAASAPYYARNNIPYLPNLDTIADPAKIKWASYLSLPAYKSTVGVYEGGYYAATGTYRPEFTSIMRDFTAIRYNAPSREAIVRRIDGIIGVPFDINDFLQKDKAAIPVTVNLSPNNNRTLPLRDFIRPQNQISLRPRTPDQIIK
jgi:hypothetical protein